MNITTELIIYRRFQARHKLDTKEDYVVFIVQKSLRSPGKAEVETERTFICDANNEFEAEQSAERMNEALKLAGGYV